MNAPNEVIRTGQEPEVPHVAVEVVDVLGNTVSELELTPRETYVMNAAIVGKEDKLEEMFPAPAVEAAEESAREVIHHAVVKSFPAEDAKKAEPLEAAESTLIALNRPDEARPTLVATEHSSEEPDEIEDDAIAFDPFADDDDEAPEETADVEADAADFAKDFTFFKEQSSAAQEALKQEDESVESEHPTFTLTAAKIGEEALALEIGEVSDEALRDELEQVRAKLARTVMEAEQSAQVTMAETLPAVANTAPRPVRMRRLVGALTLASMLSIPRPRFRSR